MPVMRRSVPVPILAWRSGYCRTCSSSLGCGRDRKTSTSPTRWSTFCCEDMELMELGAGCGVGVEWIDSNGREARL